MIGIRQRVIHIVMFFPIVRQIVAVRVLGAHGIRILSIGNSVIVRIGIRRVGPHTDLSSVADPVPVRIDVQDVYQTVVVEISRGAKPLDDVPALFIRIFLLGPDRYPFFNLGLFRFPEVVFHTVPESVAVRVRIHGIGSYARFHIVPQSVSVAVHAGNDIVIGSIVIFLMS